VLKQFNDDSNDNCPHIIDLPQQLILKLLLL